MNYSLINKFSRTPTIRTPVILIANYPDRLEKTIYCLK